MIKLLSNEIEFEISHPYRAPQMIRQFNALMSQKQHPLTLKEEIESYMIELNVSQCKNPEQLNRWVSEGYKFIRLLAKKLKTQVRGGGTPKSTDSQPYPKNIRKLFALEDQYPFMMSYQIVLGIDRSKIQQLFNTYYHLIHLSPHLALLSGNSPFTHLVTANGVVLKTDPHFNARILFAYPNIIKNSHYTLHPFFLQPHVRSLTALYAFLKKRTKPVIRTLHSYLLHKKLSDIERAIVEDLLRDFTLAGVEYNIYTYYYPLIRIRPDHANKQCVASLEVRVCDNPGYDLEESEAMVKALNTFIPALLTHLQHTKAQPITHKRYFTRDKIPKPLLPLLKRSPQLYDETLHFINTLPIPKHHKQLLAQRAKRNFHGSPTEMKRLIHNVL
jgi:hypothetical protein